MTNPEYPSTPSVPDPVDSVLQALANFALLEDQHPTHTTSRADRTKYHELAELIKANPPRMTEAMWMLAAYCFDLSRRFAFVHAAISTEIKGTASPREKLKEAVARDDDVLNVKPKPGDNPWEQRAEIAAEQLQAWHNRVRDAQTKSQGEFFSTF